MGSLWKLTPIDLYLHYIVCNIFVLFPHRTWCWMFRHSDGNKNSWEEEKANKAFLSIHHHQGTILKTTSVFSGKYFGISYFGKHNCLVAWTTATKIRDFKGAPSTHICPILPPDLSPDAHLFCPRGTVFVENITPRNLADNFHPARQSYFEQHQECRSRRWRSR